MPVKDIENLTIEDIKPITISFKKNEDELNLYKWILSHSNYSGFVKDILRAAKEKEVNPKETKVVHEVKESGLIDMNF